MPDRPVGEVIWNPPAETLGTSNISTFRRWVNERFDCTLESYGDLWSWTVDDVGRGWGAMWDFAGLPARAPGAVTVEGAMPGATWFPDSTVNLAEQILTRTDAGGDTVVMMHRVEGDARYSCVTWDELRADVARVAESLRARGVVPGDHVVAVLPNIPEAMIACLATISIGAVWSSCAPDFAADAIVERFTQIAPKVLFAAAGYRYGGRWFDRTAELDAVRRGLPSIEATIVVGDGQIGAATEWAEFVGSSPAPALSFHPTAFGDPVWVLFTSGTTGRPKGLVQGHGGAVLAAVQGLFLHLDLRRSDRLAQHTSTGWVVWNLVLSSLMFCDSIVLYDGSATYPSEGALLQLAADADATMVGLSGSYLSLLARRGPSLDQLLGGHQVRGMWFTGSGIGLDDYDWAVDGLPERTWFNSVTGGTDVGATFFLAGSIDEPLRRGQFECRGLGVAIDAFDAQGNSVIDEPGELVITAPTPSMPLRLVNDPGYDRYRASYFADYEGVWRHGDLVVLHENGGGTVLGRSDATLNRNGIRIGTAEVYSAVETIAEVQDALVIDLSTPDRPNVVLFVAADQGVDVVRCEAEIRSVLRTTRSPRHVPDRIEFVPEVPRTLNGKRVEVPVKRLLLGAELADVANPASLANPTSLDWFVEHGRSVAVPARELSEQSPGAST